MAETIKFNKSNFLPQKAGHEFLEVEVTDDAVTSNGMRITPVIPLGKSYRSVKCVSSTLSTGVLKMADAAISTLTTQQAVTVAFLDTSSVRIIYYANTNLSAKVTASVTLECEV
jgi:hypothetical protein